MQHVIHARTNFVRSPLLLIISNLQNHQRNLKQSKEMIVLKLHNSTDSYFKVVQIKYDEPFHLAIAA